MSGKTAPSVPSRSGRRAVAAQTGWLGAARVSGVVAATVSLLLVSRVASTEVLASYGLALLLVTVVGVAADGGLGTVGVVRVAAAPEQGGGIIRLRVLLGVLVAAAAVAAAWPVCTVGGAVVGAAWLSGAVTAGLVAAGSGVLTVAQARLRNELTVAADVIMQVSALAGLCVVLLVGGGVWWVTGSLVIGAAMRLLAAWLIAARSGTAAWGRLDVVDRRQVVRQAAPMMGWNTVGTLHLKVGGLVVFAVLGANAFAVFGVVFRVVDLMLIAPGLLLGPALPVLAQAVSDEARWTRVRQSLVDAIVPSGVAVAAVAVSAAPVIAAVFGSGDTAVLLLRWFAVSGACVWINTLFVALMVVRNKQVTACTVAAGTLVMNGAVTAGLIGVWGVQAAGFASLTAELVLTAAVGYVVLRRDQPLSWRRPAQGVAVAGVAAVGGWVGTVTVNATVGTATAGLVVVMAAAVVVRARGSLR